jgi:hypothetical protein
MMGGMDDLVQFLRDRLDEDEQTARDAKPGPWREDGGGSVFATHPTDEVVDYTDSAPHIARHDPARVLAEVDAKRRILLLHNIPAVVSPKMAALGLREGEAPEDDRRCAGCGLDNTDDPITPDVNECPILRALALPYAGHPDYRAEWRTTS